MGFVEPFERLVERVRRILFGDSVNPLGFGYLQLTFCGFDQLQLTLGGILTERCNYTDSSPPDEDPSP